MKKINILLLMILILSVPFIFIPLSKSFLCQIIISILFSSLLYIFILALKYDNKYNYKKTNNNRYIVPVICIALFLISSTIFQILIYLNVNISYNHCIFMSLLHLIITMILIVITIYINKRFSKNKGKFLPLFDIILVINTIGNFTVSFLLIFGYYVTNSGIIIVS